MGAPIVWHEADKRLLRQLVTNGVGLPEICVRMDRTPGAVCSAAKRYGAIWPKKKSPTRPDDFAEQWAKMGQRTLAVHYGVSEHWIAKWKGELGLSRPPSIQVTRQLPKPKPRKVQHGVTPYMGQPKAPAIIGEAIRDMSDAGRAADYLRRYGPVFRRDGAWMRGTSRLTDSEIITRAQQMGWIL